MKILSSELYVKDNKVYHEGNKPKPKDIGAAPETHTHNYASATTPGGSAEHAIKATEDSLGQRIDKYIKGLSVSGRTITYTRGDGTTGTITTQDTNTDTKVTNTLNTTAKAYITGTTDSATNTGTQVFDTNVYLDTTAGMLTATTFKGALQGNATTATSATSASHAAKLTTPRSINGTNFDGTSNITTVNWGTARNIYVADADGTNTGAAVSVNGSGNATLKLPSTIKASLTGNATTATTLATARTINGTSFNGSANITTANWGTARTLTVGSASKSVNGSANVTWSLDEIGARTRIKKVIDLSNTKTYSVDKWYPCLAAIPYDGMHDIEVAVQLNSGVKPSWATHEGGFTCNLHVKAIAGGWGTTTANSIVLNHSSGFTSVHPCSYSQLTNSSNAVLWLRGGGKYFVFTDWNASWSIKTASTEISSQTVAPATSCPSIALTKATMIADLSGNASTATTLQTARTINGTSFNGSGNITTAQWGTARTLTIGNTGKSVNGAGNVSWSLSEIGAAATSHNHGLLHDSLGVTVANTTTDSGWSMINSSYNGFLLKSIRSNASAPAWLQNNYAAGIAFGGGDTKGVVSVAYNTPSIRFAGGNSTKPVWYLTVTGNSGKTYNLETLTSNITSLQNELGSNKTTLESNINSIKGVL